MLPRLARQPKRCARCRYAGVAAVSGGEPRHVAKYSRFGGLVSPWFEFCAASANGNWVRRPRLSMQ
jgi:hypothetical protein